MNPFESQAACETLAEDVPICFRIEKGGIRTWLSHAELARLGQSLKLVRAIIANQGYRNPLHKTKNAEGVEWWQVEAVDGEESLVFLHPEWLDVVGETAVVAAPARGVVLSWNSGDTDNDKIIAVGVRRIFEAADVPVSPKIFRYTPEGWAVWGEAVLPKKKPLDPKPDKPKIGEK